jgi:hypothetical protein
MGVMRRPWLVLVAALACGDDLAPPETLVEDPAVERGCSPVTGSPAPFSRAKRVGCAEELPAGLLVSGRVGDILLENDRVQIVVRGFGEGYLFPGTPPGGVVDAAPRGGDDQLKELFPIADLNMIAPDQIVITEAGDDGPATLVIRGPGVPVPLVKEAIGARPIEATVETHYLLAPGADHLTIRTGVRRDGASSNQVAVGDAFFFGGRVEPFIPGVGDPTGGIARGPLLASAGSATTSYGLAPATGGPELETINISSVNVALAGSALVNGDPVERSFVIGDGSIASAVARGLTLRGDPTGTVRGSLSRAPGDEVSWVDLVVEDQDGRPISVARVADDGPFEIEVPPGSYQLRASSPGHAPAEPVAAQTGGAPATVPLGGSGVLALTVADTGGAALPARITVRGAAGEQVHYSGASGEVRVPLAPGSYAVDVSRGIEYDVFTAEGIDIADGAMASVEAVLERVLDTDGWISMDTHLHSEMSGDSRIPLPLRLAAVAGEGVEVAISSDHDFVIDYAKLVSELGLGGWMLSQVGSEVTTLLWGHVNSWPMPVDADRAGGGAIAWYGKSPGQVFDEMRRAGPGVVVQVNHPRRGGSGLLEAIRFDPDTARATRDPAELGLEGANLDDFDFDAIEIPGKGGTFDVSFADWLALVDIGHRVAATGSSDSHMVSQFVGDARTYVWVGPGADDLATLDLAQVDAALRARRAVVAEGVFVTAAIEDPSTGQPALPGELVDLSGQSSARLHVKVQAPPWMPTSGLRVFAGRAQAHAAPLDPDDTAVIRFEQVIELLLDLDAGDSFFVVLVDPGGPGTPVLGNAEPSFTNPLTYDQDGDGLWTRER